MQQSKSDDNAKQGKVGKCLEPEPHKLDFHTRFHRFTSEKPFWQVPRRKSNHLGTSNAQECNNGPPVRNSSFDDRFNRFSNDNSWRVPVKESHGSVGPTVNQGRAITKKF